MTSSRSNRRGTDVALGRPAASDQGEGNRVELIPDPSTSPVLTAEQAFALLGIDRTTGYLAIRKGSFPVPVLRVGRLIRIPTLPLLRALGLDDGPCASPGEPNFSPDQPDPAG